MVVLETAGLNATELGGYCREGDAYNVISDDRERLLNH